MYGFKSEIGFYPIEFKSSVNLVRMFLLENRNQKRSSLYQSWLLTRTSNAIFFLAFYTFLASLHRILPRNPGCQ